MNEQTNWQPPTIKHGRYGEWLRNNVDWALSRTRYWGTPLPVWVCPQQHVTCVGLAGRAVRAGRARPDRAGPAPALRGRRGDHLPGLRRPARRVPEVIDVWYDSGSMPFAQFGAPLANEAEFERSFPAQFICEAIDQTRGWFYSLMAVSTLVFGRNSYENVVCLGLLVDERGRKMSKHLGNVLEPMPLMDAHGADAVRWFFAASGSPWATRKIGPARARGDRPQGAADLLEHGVVPGPVRERRGGQGAWMPGGGPRRPGRPAGRCSTGGC